MNKLTVGLVGTGSKTWIAGVNYLNSLIYANSLLPQTQQNKFHLFLHEVFNDETDFDGVCRFAKSVESFDFYYGAAFATLRRIILPFRTAWLQREFPRRIKNNLPRSLVDKNCQIIFPANDLLTNGPSSVKTISLIHDFQYKYFPEYFRNVAYIDLKTKKALRFSDLIIVNNEYSNKDAQKYFPEYCHKIRVLPYTMWLGPGWDSQSVKTVIQKYHLPKKYLMFPSQFWIHKNHRRLFEAIAILKQRGHTEIRLVCTGYTHDHRNPSYARSLYSYIEFNGLQENIQILGFLPRHEQIQILRRAAAVVQPSLFDGHSAILDEVKSLGKKVFVSDIPMHRDQQGNGFIFFDPYDPVDLANKLESDWSSINPGPDMEAEKFALEKYILNLRTFGIRFTEICSSIV